MDNKIHKFSLKVVLSASLIALTLFGGWIYITTFGGGDNFSLLILAYLQILVIVTLAVVVGRNIVKLIFDRKREVLGAKLRTKLVLAFGGLTLIPAILLFIVASGLLNRAFEGWLSKQVSQLVESSLVVAQRGLALESSAATAAAEEVRDQLAKSLIQLNGDKALQNKFHERLEELRRSFGLFRLAVYGPGPKVLDEASHPTASVAGFQEPPIKGAFIEASLRGAEQTISEVEEGSPFVRVGLPLGDADRRHALVAVKRLDPEQYEALGVVQDTYVSFGQLKVYRSPLRSSYLLALAGVTLLVLFAAVWVAFAIAKYIVGPVERLVGATAQVSSGNYDIVVGDASDDELGILVESFNKMTRELGASRRESEQRRLLIERIFRQLAVGVVSVDRQGKISAVNPVFLRLLNVSCAEGMNLLAALLPEHRRVIQPLMEELESLEGNSILERHIQLQGQGRVLEIALSVGKIMNTKDEWIETLLVVDDVTELAKAQSLAAWREVARRIAHEIKNPLTPIQLSAQRLQRAAQRGDDLVALVKESSPIIVENVDSIKRLADEFSQFARMPAAVLELTDLNYLLRETIFSLGERHAEVSFNFIGDESLPMIMIDPEHIRRMVLNLLENAAASILGDLRQSKEGPSGSIEIRSLFNPREEKVVVEICDNGPGVSEEIRGKIFDPYFTTKKGGTGLGLAIVSSIVAERGGKIRVFSRVPRGARFVVELPLKPSVQPKGREV